MTETRRAIAAAVDRLAPELDGLVREIHAAPELAFQERQAAALLTGFLERHGFAVERGVGGLETAFRATLGAGEGPTVALLCEYDALPEIGHACGHNLIAAAGAGAGAAVAAARAALPAGRVVVIGTPAEEGGGGKIRLIEAGVFAGVDCAMMVHGFDATWLSPAFLGNARVQFTFHGRAAHAAVEPWEGANALDAVIQTFNAVALLRQQMRPECRIHGIIREGGTAVNVIPERAVALFSVRAPSLELLWPLFDRVVACAEGAARATGTRVDHARPASIYEPFRNNRALLTHFKANLATTELPGPHPDDLPGPVRTGSSDVGNLSQLLPTIHPMIQMAEPGTALHTRDFAAATLAPRARVGVLASARAMALTAYDLLSDPAAVARIRAEHAG